MVDADSIERSVNRGVTILKLLRDIAQEFTTKKQGKKDPSMVFADLGMTASVLLLELKRCNREVFVGLHESKKLVTAKKESLDAAFLGLQNLEYEKAHLLRQIERNQSIKTVEMDKIKLVSEKEYKKSTGDTLKRHGNDRHAYQLSRLAHELSTRQSQHQAGEELEFKRVAISRQTAAKSQFISGLPRHLRQIEKSTEPLQKYIKMPTSLRRKKHERAKSLPSPLYVLYCQFEGYIDAFSSQQSGSVSNIRYVFI